MTEQRSELPMLERAFLAFCFMYFSGSYIRLLSGKEITAANGVGSESPLNLVVGACISVLTLSILVKRRQGIAGPLTMLCFMLLLYTSASAIWAGDPMLSLRRSAAIWGVALFATYVTTSFSSDQRQIALRDFARVFIVGNTLACLNPSYGFHTLNDAFYTEHAGAMRGLYYHKNNFAQYAGLVVLITVATYKRKKTALSVDAICLGVSVVMVVLSRSAQVLVALPLGLSAYFAFSRLKSFSQRISAVVAVAWLGLLLYLSGIYDGIVGEVLGALDRDPTLSFRTVIWDVVISAGSSHWLLGGGFGVAWSGGVSEALIKTIGQDVGNPHNGFIQAWLDLGAVGVTIFAVIFSFALWRTLKVTQGTPSAPLVRFGFAFLVVYFTINMAGSVLIKQDLFFCIFLIVAFSLDRDRCGQTGREPADRKATLLRRTSRRGNGDPTTA